MLLFIGAHLHRLVLEYVCREEWYYFEVHSAVSWSLVKVISDLTESILCEVSLRPNIKHDLHVIHGVRCKHGKVHEAGNTRELVVDHNELVGEHAMV